MTDKEHIAQLERRLEGIATLLNLEPGHVPDRWVGHIEERIREWYSDREQAWADNDRLRAEKREAELKCTKLWYELQAARADVEKSMP